MRDFGENRGCACRGQRVTAASVTVDGRIVGGVWPRAARPPRHRRGRRPGRGRATGRQGRAAADLRERRRASSTARSLDIGGEALVVSQFTLIADSRRQKGIGRTSRAPPDRSWPSRSYERFCDALRDAWRAGRDRGLRSTDAGRARQRRPGDDHPRCRVWRPIVGTSCDSPAGNCVTKRRTRHSSRDNAHRLRWTTALARPPGAILSSPHFTGLTKWAQGAHFC